MFLLLVRNFIKYFPRSWYRLFLKKPVSISGLQLDSQIQLLLKIVNFFSAKDNSQIPLDELRAQSNKSTMLFSGSDSDSLEKITNATIQYNRTKIPIRIYRPFTPEKQPPAIVFYHGGGWVTGNLDAYDSICQRLAYLTQAMVFSVDYRLAPEHKFPAAAEDALAAYQWVTHNAHIWSIDTKRITVMGDSAGGNLAAMVCQQVCQQAISRPALQVLIYPVVDLANERESYQTFAEGYLLTRQNLRWYKSQYLAETAQAKDPQASPLLASSFENLPPALIYTAGFDPLKDEGLAYAKKLKENQIEVKYRCHTSLVHGFFAMAGVIRAADRAFVEIATSTRSFLVKAQR